MTVDPAPTLRPGFDTFVQTGYQSDQSTDKELKLGYVFENGVANTARSFIRWSTLAIRGKRVVDAKLYLYNHWSYSCNPAKWQVWITGAVGTSTNWDRQPSWGGEGKPIVESTQTKGYSSNCNDGYVVANVRSTFQWAADENVSTLTTGLRAAKADEDGRKEETWKRFSSAEGTKDPYVSLTYNSRPSPPSEVTIGGVKCGPGQPRAFVSRKPYFPNAQAKVVDPDKTERPLTAQFFIAEKGQPLPIAPTMTDGATHLTFATAAVPKGFPLTENKTYVMRVKATDSIQTSEFSELCEFTVDSAGPAKPPAVTSPDYGECLPALCEVNGGVGSSGDFTLSANGIADVAKYRYWFDGESKVEVVPDVVGGSVMVRIAPPPFADVARLSDLTLGGQRVLHVESVDVAGRTSAEYRNAQVEDGIGYSMLVGSAAGPDFRWKLDEPAGATTAQSSGENSAALKLEGGITMGVPGRGDGGTAARFDGLTAMARYPHLIRDQNQTISMAVKLAEKGTNRIVVQHHNNGMMKFALFYDAKLDKWCVKYQEQASGGGGEPYEPGWTGSSCSAVTPRIGVWTHLAVAMDDARQTLGLYVDGRPADSSAKSDFVLPSHYFRNTEFGAMSFVGDMDDVQVDWRLLTPQEIGALASLGTGRWDLDWSLADGTEHVSSHGLRASSTPEDLWNDVGHLEMDLGSVWLEGGNHLATDAPVVRTDQSFSVSAWVSLASLPAKNVTVVAQDGAKRSGFYLGARAFGANGVQWSFSVPDDDTDQAGRFAHTAISVPIADDDIGAWVHLVGVYDASAQQIRLYVDGQPATPTARTARWQANGALTIGRGLWTNTGLPTSHTDFLTGSVDAVRTYAGVLTPDMVTRLYQTPDGRL